MGYCLSLRDVDRHLVVDLDQIEFGGTLKGGRKVTTGYLSNHVYVYSGVIMGMRNTCIPGSSLKEPGDQFTVRHSKANTSFKNVAELL